MATNPKDSKAVEPVKLPSLSDLLSDEENLTEEAKALTAQLWAQNQINVLLNQPPPKKWLMNHPMAKKKKRMSDGSIKDVPWEYLPINRQEFLMTWIFIRWHVEVKDVQLLANSVAVTVRVHYLNRATGLMEWMDGVGAAPLQTDSGKGAIDFMYIKNAAVQMALPAAKSYSFKDAVETLGNIFGKDINRMDEIDYTPLLNQVARPSKAEELAEKLTDPSVAESLR